MAEVSVHIGGRDYLVHCKDGEEAHLARLVAIVDAKTAQARHGTNGLTEVRQLLFASILLADELTESKQGTQGSETSRDQPAATDSVVDTQQLVDRLNRMAERIESITQSLAGQSA